MKKTLWGLACGLFLCGMTGTTAYAKDITVKLEAPEGFSERVEVFFDKFEQPMYKSMGYTMVIELEEKPYTVNVLSSTDVLDLYEFQYNKTFNPAVENVFEITAVKASAYSSGRENAENAGAEDIGEDGEFYEGSYTNVEGDPMLAESPAEYDYTEAGEAYGTFRVSCKNYPAFDTLTFSLVGESQIYNITLDREHNFSANVKLPVGDYYESSAIQYEYSDIIDAEPITVTWRHRDRVGSYGDYYHIRENETVTLDDLVIYMTYKGDITEVNTNILMDAKVYAEQLEIQESHWVKELAEAFPGDYETSVAETETQTIAEAPAVTAAAEEETESISLKNVVLLIAAIAIMISVIAAVLHIRSGQGEEDD